MSKKRPKRPQPEQEEPEVKDFLEIGGSPVLGLTLRHVLRGHTESDKPHRVVAGWRIPRLAF